MDVNARDSFGLTPLHLATTSGQVDRVEELLKNGANPNAENSMGMTPLHLAARFPSTDIAVLLLKHGARVNHRTGGGTTPIQSAAMEGNIELIGLLSRNGADATIKDSNGVNAIDLAKDEITETMLISEATFLKGERCESCGISEFAPDVSLKRCVNCKVAFYCGKTCQKKDWKEQHKVKCQAFAIGRPNFFGMGNDGCLVMTNNTTFSTRMVTTEDSLKGIRKLGSERFLVKVQVPFYDNEASMTVYNKDESVVVTISKDSQGFSEIRTKIINEGCQWKIKAYLWAQRHGDDAVKIFYGKLAPFQSW